MLRHWKVPHSPKVYGRKCKRIKSLRVISEGGCFVKSSFKSTELTLTNIFITHIQELYTVMCYFTPQISIYNSMNHARYFTDYSILLV